MTIALALLGRAGSGLLALLARIPLIAYVVMAVLGWGAWQHHLVAAQRAATAAEQLVAAHVATALSEKNRETEKVLATKNLEIANAQASADAARVAAAAAVGERLRALAHAKSASAERDAALASCRSYDAPAVSVLPDSTRENLVRLATDADEVASHLRSCQAYVTSVLGVPYAP